MKCSVRVGGDLGPIGEIPNGRHLLDEYLTYLLSPDPMPKTLSSIQRTTRDWWKRRYPPTSHSNWRQAKGNGRIPTPPSWDEPAHRRRRSVPDGERTKSESYEFRTTLTGVWKRGLPVSAPEFSDELETVSRSINYHIGSVESFHECIHSWNVPIAHLYPVCGLIRTGDTVEWEGYVPEVNPDDWRYSYGHFASRNVTRGTPLWIPTRDYPAIGDYPSSSEVDTARYNALLSMYGGTPPTNPNLLRALIELKDTSKTIQGVVHFYKWARHMVSGTPFWRRTLSGWRRMTAAEVVRLSTQEMAGAYLNGVFGIAPTLDDARVFLHRLFNGLDILSVPQGRPAVPGSVITSRYHVHHRVSPKSGQTSVGEELWLDTHATRHSMTCSGVFNYRDLGNWLRSYPDILTDHISGCVFARLKEDLSQYFLDNFGKVGLTWSYPPILTAYELVPWTWLIDWFSQTREKVRQAERAARTFWMRVGFNAPWLAERRVHVRYCHRVTEDRVIDSDNKVFFPSYNQRVLAASVVSAYTTSATDFFEIGGEFWRGPYEGAPLYQSEATGITVRAFQISVGMALALSTR